MHIQGRVWRIYLSGEDGVAIRSSVDRLRTGLARAADSLIIGRVRYLNYRRDRVPVGHELDPFFCKRKSFEYESEVRLLLRSEEKTDDVGRYVEADLDRLIEGVVVSPSSEAWFRELVSSVTLKYGFRLPVGPSSMLDPPPDATGNATTSTATVTVPR